MLSSKIPFCSRIFRQPPEIIELSLLCKSLINWIFLESDRSSYTNDSVISSVKSEATGVFLTGIRLNELLRASHIKPWRISSDAERLDSANGILLAAHVDILFDKGLISFDDEGNLLTKNTEVDTLLEQMNIQTRKIDLPIESRKYLKWHRDSFNYPM